MKQKVKIKKNKNIETYNVSFNDLTKGELLALNNALKKYSEISPVGADVSTYLKNGISSSATTDSSLSDFFKYSY